MFLEYFSRVSFNDIYSNYQKAPSKGTNPTPLPNFRLPQTCRIFAPIN